MASLPTTLFHSFLGHSPNWYKWTIIAFLVLNPFILWAFGPFVVGWLLVLQFIFTLAMALQCYPLLAGGLLGIEAVLMQLTTPKAIYVEATANVQVIFLLVFMVAGIYFMKDLLMALFTRLLLGVKNKRLLSLLFCFSAAFLSAFLDALTVTAVIISVTVGFYEIYHRAIAHETESLAAEDAIHLENGHDLAQFRRFLRSLLMHAVVGTALGGVCTMVGEPQNLLIAEKAGWSFIEFFYRMAPVSIPVFFAGLVTCYLLEKMGWFGYGVLLPGKVRKILQEFATEDGKKHTPRRRVALWVQGLVGLWLILALGFHWAEAGLIGLAVIIFITAFNGITEEHAIGHAFQEALPFTSLLMVFFCVVAVIHDQGLFSPIIDYVLATKGEYQIALFYLANGILSSISDNVFVATVYINEAYQALKLGHISQHQFDLIAIAINTGTNLPSVATPNGQAAFLFLLTSAIAPLVRLSYGRMVWMAIPYTIVLTLVGLLCVYYLLEPVTELAYVQGLIVSN